MKKLVIFYSFEGNTKFIGKSIADEINGDVLELKPEKEIKSKKFGKYLIGGFQSILKIKPKLQTFNVSFKNYDLIFIGTPVWASSISPSLRSFFSSNTIKNSRIALFSCYAAKQGNSFKQMRHYLKSNDILGEKGFINPLNDKDNNEKVARQWANDIVKKQMIDEK